MSQYYPQQPGFYPPPSRPESNDEEEYEDYEIDDSGGQKGDSWLMRCGIFVLGSCFTSTIVLACVVLSAALWVIDPCSDCFAPSYENSDIGLTFNEPAKQDQAVVNEQGLQLVIKQVDRNAASNTIPPTEGIELIVVTVELTNLSEDEINYEVWVRDEEAEEPDVEKSLLVLLPDELHQYPPTPGAIDGSLEAGTLNSMEGNEGRLVFPVKANAEGLVLEWTGAEGTTPRYIELD